MSPTAEKSSGRVLTVSKFPKNSEFAVPQLNPQSNSLFVSRQMRTRERSKAGADVQPMTTKQGSSSNKLKATLLETSITTPTNASSFDKALFIDKKVRRSDNLEELLSFKMDQNGHELRQSDKIYESFDKKSLLIIRELKTKMITAEKAAPEDAKNETKINKKENSKKISKAERVATSQLASNASEGSKDVSQSTQKSEKAKLALPSDIASTESESGQQESGQSASDEYEEWVDYKEDKGNSSPTNSSPTFSPRNVATSQKPTQRNLSIRSPAAIKRARQNLAQEQRMRRYPKKSFSRPTHLERTPPTRIHLKSHDPNVTVSAVLIDGKPVSMK